MRVTETEGSVGGWVRGTVSYGNSDREYSEWVERMGCGWFLTPDPADLNPLDGSPRHLYQTLPRDIPYRVVPRHLPTPIFRTAYEYRDGLRINRHIQE